MPTVRGLIQDIQHNGLLKQAKLSLLSGCTIGVDATLYFDPLYTPPSTSDVLGMIDAAGLDLVVKKHLAQFQKHKITPIFVFPGVSTSDRVYTTQQQEDQYLEQLKQQQEQQKQQQTLQITQQQTQQDNDADFGFYRPMAKNKRNKKNQFAAEPMQPANGMVLAGATQPQHNPPIVSATSSIASPIDGVQWSFDEQSLLNRQRGWDNVNGKNFDTAQQLFHDMSTTFTFQYRKALLQLLQKHQQSGEFGQFSILLAPYSVSAQLAWLQRAPHHYVHAVIGQSDILLFGVERFLQTINFESQSFNFILLSEVLAKYAVTLKQLVIASVLTGYSYSLTHPLALNDFKTPSTYSFSNALNHIRTYGNGSLQTLLEWWVQQPPGPTTATTGPVNEKAAVKDDLLHLPNIMSLEDQMATISPIIKVLQQIQGSLVFGHGAQLVLLRDAPVEAIDVVKIKAYGKCAQRAFKEQVKAYQKEALQNNLTLLKGKQLASILKPVAITPPQLLQQYQADKITIPEALVEAAKDFVPATTTTAPTDPTPIIPVKFPSPEQDQIQTRPTIPLPEPILRLVSSATIQPASISSILTGHILDVTVQNPSNELDQVLDWTNLALRGPAIWSLLYALNHSASTTNSTIDPAYKTLYSAAIAQEPQGPQKAQKLPFVLNSRFNDKRKQIWPRDIIAYCRRGGSDSDSVYGVDKINQFENVDKLFGKEQLDHFQTIIKNVTKTTTTNTTNNTTITTSPISHYLTLIPALHTVQPHPNPATATQGKKKNKQQSQPETITIVPAAQDAITLNQEEQFIGLGMMYILYFIGLITAQGTMTKLGYAIMQLVQSLQIEGQINPQLYDTLLFIYILTAASDVMTTKMCTIESSELNNSQTVLNGKNESTEQQRFARVVFRLLAILPADLQTTILNTITVAPPLSPLEPESTTTPPPQTLAQVLLATQPTTPEEIALAKRLATPAAQPAGSKTANKSNNVQKQQQLQDRFVPHQLLTILNRETACYSSIITSLLHALNYSFDLVLTALSLYQIYPQLNFQLTPTLVPLQDYQPSPILSSLLRQRYITNPPTKNKKAAANRVQEYSLLAPQVETLNEPTQKAIVGIWEAIVKGTGGVGITTDDIAATLKAMM